MQHCPRPDRLFTKNPPLIINAWEAAFDEHSSLHSCSWDMRKAFDSVTKALIILCWHNLGCLQKYLDTLLI